uniref:EGF-like domain-containing protein n=1 Tax=Chromera velia CCMP2878 TaxID=1169474 RepID=A0A0G4HK22_9ALVE|eukprot:Cvel_7222.t1-p1 / transcript=Cvel_7222.t1 / gene=Cvel_7222 / organism=Chromera_velia_CCMP2878 / gene_product=Fibrillin-2, putative / transcript_product=Fibrillin-2, putative / location=Cvel_scaffold372:31983-63954(+) / protein_length=5109 / sequence_SO=supercontig / SO=protein_coding / is_pseudo=false
MSVTAQGTVQVPPSDIGEALTWTTDSSVTYGGLNTFYKDSSSGPCPGRYRARTNNTWWASGPPNAVFDNTIDSSIYSTLGELVCSTDVDCNIELILEIPCLAYLSSYQMKARTSCCGARVPTSFVVSGSLDGGSDWTQIDARNGEAAFSDNETRDFTLTGASQALGPFRWFKLLIKRTGSATTDALDLDNVFMYATIAPALPPTDVGQANTWTKDGTETLNSIYSIYKDYSGDETTCTGRFRVKTNTAWVQDAGVSSYASDEWPPSGAFDRIVQDDIVAGWAPSGVSGSGGSSDSEVRLIVELPCFIHLKFFTITYRDYAVGNQGPVKFTVYGAAPILPSRGNPFVALATFDGETGWGAEETRTFSVNSTTPYNIFDFVFHRIDDTAASGILAIGDIVLYPSETLALEVIPPMDIGASTEWTKDSSVTSNGQYSMYKDYAGSVCPGRYRGLSNMAWLNDDGWTSGATTFGSNEWPVSGAFDFKLGSSNDNFGFSVDSIPNSGTDSGTDATLEVVLHTPCRMKVEGFAITHRDGTQDYVGQAPHTMTLYGSADAGASWSALGFFTGETSWVKKATKIFPADSSLGFFDQFKFHLQKLNWASDQSLAISDMYLLASAEVLTQIPPSDIGTATTWTKDPSVTYNNIPSMYTDYNGSVCPGKFRATTNEVHFGDGGWYSTSDPWFVAGAFDRQPLATHGSGTGYCTASSSVSGYADAGESNVELILQTPCSVHLKEYGITSRNDNNAPNLSPSKMIVYGSADGSSWTQIGSFTNETSWTQGERKNFAADSTLGPFTYFKFDSRRISKADSWYLCFGELHLLASSVTDLCGDGSHNCDANATCTNAGSSFTCACNGGLDGDGISCSALTLIPPADIGTSATWTKDPSVTYNTIYTLYKDYGGSVCPGRYRAKANIAWYGDGGWYSFGSGEWAPSGLFDRKVGYDTVDNGFSSDVGNVANTGTDVAADGNVEVVIQVPCSARLHSYGIQARGNDGFFSTEAVPSKAIVYGSTDESTWTPIGSFSGEILWSPALTKWFTSNSTTTEYYNHFKFSFLKVSSATDFWIAFGDIELYTDNWIDLCTLSAHNCDANATCANAGSSFTCACNSGFTGDGVSSCSALTLIPPSDIGRGDTWTKDATVTHNSVYTLYKDYSGSVCRGRYRAKANIAWVGDAGSGGGFGVSEWAPSGAFDGVGGATQQTSGFSPHVPQPGTDAASDADIELILQTPCLLEMHEYAIQARVDASASQTSQTPSKMSVRGSLDCSGTWTELGSFEGEINWSTAETRSFSVNSTLGAFNCFSFTAKRVSQAADKTMSIGDIKLYGVEMNIIPPSDIGTGGGWTKDPSVTFNGVKTVYKDYTGAVCPGRYRAMSNLAWANDNGWYSFGANEWPPSGAFDRQIANDNLVTGYHTAAVLLNSGMSVGPDANLELVLRVPCSISLEFFDVQARAVALDTTASKAAMYGSTDGSSWTLLGSFSGETSWTSGETRRFSADSSLGPFNYFKLDVQKLQTSTDNGTAVGDVALIGSVTDLCGDSSHNCDGNATCANSGSSFTCACNYGFTGDGLSCSALTLVPSADIGAGGTWTEDSSETYSGLSTFTKGYSGTICPGTFRAKTNKAWNPSGTLRGYPSGAFDRKPVSFGEAFYASTTPAPSNVGTDSGTNGDVELIIDLPCMMPLLSYGIQPQDTGTHLTQTPSQLVVSGSVDGGTSWTEVASYTGEVNNWEFGVTRGFQVNTSNADAAKAYSSFKFDIQKISSATDVAVVIGDIELYTDPVLAVTQIPPSDIGAGNTWTNDPSTTHNGLNTQYTDYAGSVCPGRYRVMSNTDWTSGSTTVYDANPPIWAPSSVFDRGGFSYQAEGSQEGQSSGAESNTEVILHTPCSVTLSSYTVTARSATSVAPDKTPSKMVVYGSVDGNAWTELGSYSGETSWAASEVKTFSANASLGFFNYFKFDIRKISGAANSRATLSEIEIFGFIQDLCGDGTANCHANATCANAGDSFTCSCNWGFSGDGVSSCTPLTQIPPSDIGRGDTWTKDDSVTYSSMYTLFTDYTGSTCPGIYRARTNTAWSNDPGTGSWATNEWPPSGAFDRVAWGNGNKAGYRTASETIPGTSAGSDSNVEVLLELPCFMRLDQFDVQGRYPGPPDGSATQSPSKAEILGSTDLSTWTLLGSFSGEISWASRETKSFTANSTAGAFKHFKLVGQRLSGSGDICLAISEIILLGENYPNECNEGTHNCHANATCTDTFGSFTCACESGFSGDGVSCTVLQCNEATDPQPNSLGENLTRIDGGGQTGYVNDTAIFQYACGNSSALSASPAVTFTCTADGPDAATWKATPPNCTALASTSLPLPPADIGQGDTWTKDPSVTHGGRHTFYKDHPTGSCAGRYRASANYEWINNSGSSGAFASNERPPSGAFDHILGGTNAYPANAALQVSSAHKCSGINGPGTADCDVELILEIPCSLSLSAFGVTAAAGATVYRDRVPGKAEMFGSSDGGSTWTSLGSFDSVTVWSEGETKLMATNDASLGPFSHFKLVVKRVAGTATSIVTLSDVLLYSGPTTLPPSDIGLASTWVADSSVTYNGISSYYRDYAGGACPGRFRSMTNTNWFSGMPIAAAFDGVASSAGNNYATDPVLGGLSEASDADVQVILELPCTMVLEQYSVQAGFVVTNNQSPSKMSVSGSNECTESGTWTEVGLFENEVTWTAEEIKTFSADTTKGAFKCFQFTGKRLSQAANQRILIGDLMLHGSDIDPDQCTLNTHDCHANASCNNTHGSFSCVCNDGWSGTGVTCADDDECSSGAHDCDANATCSDTTGSFACSCNAGFDGNGTTCTNVDECTTSVHDCDANSACTDSTGSFSCACNDGWTGDGISCSDVDECAGMQHNCDPTGGSCTNTIGSFSCSCNAGYLYGGTSPCNPDLTPGPTLISLPPTDIADGSAWIQDSSVQYNGLDTFYTAYSGSETTCHGTFRLLSSGTWQTGKEPPNAFDHSSGGFGSDETINGNGGANGYPEQYLILQLPCRVQMAGFSLLLTKCSPCVRQMRVYGSTSLSDWVLLSGYENADLVAMGVDLTVTTREFQADTCTAGSFDHFKFVLNRVNHQNPQKAVLEGEATVLAYTDECSLNAHNCNGNAACNNTVGSFECLCNDGWTGDGVNCAVLVPPSDIGAAPTWTKDGAVTYGGFHTFYKDSASGECAGRYRVRTNTAWYQATGDSGGLNTNEWPPSGAFDNALAATNTQSGWANTLQCTEAADCNAELILETPCSLAVSTFWVQAENTGITEGTPSAVTLSGSSDSGSTWTQLGSFSGETGFTQAETRNFTADSTLGAYNWFKFFIQRNGRAANDPNLATMSGAGLYGRPVLVPPSDIGAAPTWTKDGAVTYGGFHTFYKDSASGECAGRYRVRTNTAWYQATGDSGGLATNEWPPSGAFDNALAATNTQSGWANTLQCTEAADCNAELILETPCNLAVSTFWVQAENTGITEGTPSAVTLSGSSDSGSTWTQLGSFSGETGFTQAETRNFTADSTLGAYNWFKFFIQRNGRAANDPNLATMSGAGLYGRPDIDECSLNTHDCNQNATCADSIGSFTCTCNDGWTGDGVTCGNANECSNAVHDCDGNATCIDTVGSFSCACNDGFSGSGLACTAAACNETGDPVPNVLTAPLLRADGGGQVGQTGDTAAFSFTCDTGYTVATNETVLTCSATGAGTSAWQGTLPSCIGADECSSGVHNCNAGAHCTDTANSFTCACNEGYQGDGVTECALTAGPVVAEICEPDGSTPAAEVTTGYDTEIAKIQQWQSDNAGLAGAADLGAAALETLDSKLAVCLDLAPAAEKEAIAVNSAESTVETVSSLLNSMDSELSSGSSGGGSVSSGDTGSTEGGSAGGAVSTLESPTVVTAPPVKEAGSEQKEKATETALKLLTAVDNIADNLAEAVEVGKQTFIKTETLSIAIKSSPPDATSMEAQSDKTSVALQLADASTIASRTPTGSYRLTVWKTQRISLPNDAQSSSTAAKSLTLMESIVSPSPFAGSRTQEGGFVLAGLTPFVRLAARQGGEVIGAGRVPTISSTGGTRAGGSRSSRRLVGETGDGMSDESQKETVDGESRRLNAEGDTSGKNIATMTLSAPQQALLLEHRQLIENDWDAYGLGRQGGNWEVECTQLDVQNEVWTTTGCVTTGAENGLLTGQEVLCECEIRAMEAVFIIAQRYVQPSALTPTAGTSREAVREKLSDVGFEFLFRTVSVSTVFVLGLICMLVFTALRIERRLLPEIPEVPPAFSLCDCRRRAGGRGKKPTVLRAVEQQSRAKKYKQRGKGGGKGESETERRLQKVSEGARDLMDNQEEDLAVARSLFASESHALRIRKYFNPRRILAFHVAAGALLGPNGPLTTPEESEVGNGGAVTKKKNSRKGDGCAKCLSRLNWSVCRLLARLLMKEKTLGAADAPKIRAARRVRLAQEKDQIDGYLKGKQDEGEDKQEQLWSSMVVEMRGRQYELGLPFNFEEMKAKLIRAVRNRKNQTQKEKVQKFKNQKSESASSLSSSSSSDVSTKKEAAGEETDSRGQESENATSGIMNDVEDLLAMITEELGKDSTDEEMRKDLEEKVVSLKVWTEQLIQMAEEGEGSDGSHSSSAQDNSHRTAGRGRGGEFTIEVPASRRTSTEDIDRLLSTFSQQHSPFLDAEIEGAIPAPIRLKMESSNETDENEKEAEEEDEKTKWKGGSREVGERMVAVLEDLARAGLDVRVRKWRAPMAIIAPTDASREGTLPLRSSMHRSLLFLRISKAPAIAEISDQTLLTESLVFSAKLLLSLCFALILNLGTVLVGETDERHTNRRPAEVNTAPDGFGLAGYGDLEAFVLASFVKSLLVFLSVEILFSLSVEPALSSIWSPASTCGRVKPDFLLWKRKEGETKKANTENHQEGEEGKEEAPEGKKARDGRRVSVLAEPPKGLQSLEYHDFGPALSPVSGRAKVPRWVSARVYVRCRKQEVFAQRCLVGLSTLLFCLLMLLFMVIGFAGDSFPLRHKQFVLREYLLCNLLIVSFTVAVPFVWGSLQGVLVWLSIRFGFCDRLINALPSIVQFSELTRSRHVAPGKDVVKNLDGAPTADWVVPLGGGLLDRAGGTRAGGGSRNRD